ncbi:57_t:CDS:2, partial [Gigaspora margarita]
FLTQFNQTIQLNIQKEIEFSSGYKAHEIPETILLWIEKFKYTQENIAELFEEELEKANLYLNQEEYQSFYFSLELEKKYIDMLENDKNNGISNTLGLLEALETLDFKEEFTNYAFTNSSEKSLEQFPLIYNFVKFQIWSILIYQQQLEGMFN